MSPHYSVFVVDSKCCLERIDAGDAARFLTPTISRDTSMATRVAMFLVGFPLSPIRFVEFDHLIVRVLTAPATAALCGEAFGPSSKRKSHFTSKV